MPFGWKTVTSGVEGEQVNIWFSPARKEYIRVRSDSDSGTSSVEVSMPLIFGGGMGSEFMGYRRISPYFISNTPTIGQQAALRRASIRATGDFELGTIEDALDMARRYMKKYPGDA